MTDEDQDRALDRLNAVERDLLGLLGRGHTAKSIATLRSMSEPAVNERFRSARRKTGIGSSREIARLIVAQENRHDFIGLAETSVAPPSLRRPDAHRRASLFPRWRLPMAAAVLLAAAILAQQTSVSPSPATPGDASVPPVAEAASSAHATSPDLAALHAEVAGSPTDPAWSTQTATALTRFYKSFPAFSDAIEDLGVICNASLCEVRGASRAGLSADEIKTLTEAIQVRDLYEVATRLKLHLEAQTLNSTADESEGGDRTATMAAYWRRADGL